MSQQNYQNFNTNLKKEEADEEKKPMKRKKIATSKQSMELASK